MTSTVRETRDIHADLKRLVLELEMKTALSEQLLDMAVEYRK